MNMELYSEQSRCDTNPMAGVLRFMPMKSFVKNALHKSHTKLCTSENKKNCFNENEIHFPAVCRGRGEPERTSSMRRGALLVHSKTMNASSTMAKLIYYRRSSCFRHIISAVRSHGQRYSLPLCHGCMERWRRWRRRLGRWLCKLSYLVWSQPRLTLCCVLRMFYIFHCLYGVSHSTSATRIYLFP